MQAPAPDITASEWFNADALNIKKLRGRVVLVNFWAYSCMNCVRTLPYISKLHRKYSKKGLTIIGVHSPAFSFEKQSKNVRGAVRRHGIKYPVAMDNEMKTWEAYNNRFWPCHYLIDSKGRIRHVHAGEGAYAETELWIVKLLGEMGIATKSRIEKTERATYNINTTLEMHCGRRALIGNPADGTYTDSGKHDIGKIYLHGNWLHEKEYLEGTGGHITLVFRAKSVNVVMAPKDAAAAAKIFIDGLPVSKENAGVDVGPKHIVTVDRPDVYNIYSRKEFGAHELKITSDQPVKFFSFTFG